MSEIKSTSADKKCVTSLMSTVSDNVSSRISFEWVFGLFSWISVVSFALSGTWDHWRDVRKESNGAQGTWDDISLFRRTSSWCSDVFFRWFIEEQSGKVYFSPAAHISRWKLAAISIKFKFIIEPEIEENNLATQFAVGKELTARGMEHDKLSEIPSNTR